MTILRQRRIHPIQLLVALVLAGLGACDDEAQRELVSADDDEASAVDPESELWEVCEQVLAEHAPELVAGDPPAPISDAPRPAKGVCSTGEWKPTEVEYLNCGSCWHSATQAGKREEHYRRFCYTAPSPPSCGCEPRELIAWQCNLGC